MAETTLLPPAPQVARHASWLELFFDLVAVAGVGQLAHLLHGAPGPRDGGLYVVLFLAFWSAWMCLTLYGNVAAGRTRVQTVLVGMFGLAVMAAAVHGVQDGDRGRAFALAYVLVRGLGSRIWEGRGVALVDWPLAQFTLGVIPWTVSIWVAEPARYWLWTAGVVIDLAITFTFTGPRLIEALRKHRTAGKDERRPKDPRRGGPRDVNPDQGEVRAAHTDAEHLAERLGLFTLIVLGEAVYQLVEAGSDATWDRGLFFAAAGAFTAVVLLWALSLGRGVGGVPLLRPGAVAPRALLGLHCLVTGVLAAFAAGLGSAVAHADGTLPEETSRIMAVTLGAYLVIATALGAIARRSTFRRLLAAAVPAVALCVAVGAVGETDRPVLPVWLLVAALVWFWRWTREPGEAGPGDIG